MQPPGTAELLTGSHAAASPQAFEGVRNRIKQASHGRVLHKVQHIARAANIRNVVKNRENPGQKFRTSNAGKALFNGIIYRANVHIMSVELI